MDAPSSAHEISASESMARGPPAEASTFRDLLIFEERLKQSASRLRKRKRRWATIFWTGISSILILAYIHLVVPPSIVFLDRLVTLVLLLLATSVCLFFASGLYSSRIVAAQRYDLSSLPVPLCLCLNACFAAVLRPLIFFGHAADMANRPTALCGTSICTLICAQHHREGSSPASFCRFRPQRVLCQPKVKPLHRLGCLPRARPRALL